MPIREREEKSHAFAFNGNNNNNGNIAELQLCLNVVANEEGSLHARLECVLGS
jgi:hypothetical protein